MISSIKLFQKLVRHFLVCPSFIPLFREDCWYLILAFLSCTFNLRRVMVNIILLHFFFLSLPLQWTATNSMAVVTRILWRRIVATPFCRGGWVICTRTTFAMRFKKNKYTFLSSEDLWERVNTCLRILYAEFSYNLLIKMNSNGEKYSHECNKRIQCDWPVTKSTYFKIISSGWNPF